MMALMNAMRPQLHVSIIDTALPHAQLVRHLRRFNNADARPLDQFLSRGDFL
jgi:hypothetical protein